MIVDKLKERQISKSKAILQSFDFDCVKIVGNEFRL